MYNLPAADMAALKRDAGYPVYLYHFDHYNEAIWLNTTDKRLKGKLKFSSFLHDGLAVGRLHKITGDDVIWIDEYRKEMFIPAEVRFLKLNRTFSTFKVNSCTCSIYSSSLQTPHIFKCTESSFRSQWIVFRLTTSQRIRVPVGNVSVWEVWYHDWRWEDRERYSSSSGRFVCEDWVCWSYLLKGTWGAQAFPGWQLV